MPISFEARDTSGSFYVKNKVAHKQQKISFFFFQGIRNYAKPLPYQTILLLNEKQQTSSFDEDMYFLLNSNKSNTTLKSFT